MKIENGKITIEKGDTIAALAQEEGTTSANIMSALRQDYSDQVARANNGNYYLYLCIWFCDIIGNLAESNPIENNDEGMYFIFI